MQDLQRQTTEAHKLFLQTQTQASRTLQQILNQAQSVMGVTVPPQIDSQADTDRSLETADLPLNGQQAIIPEAEPKGQTGHSAAEPSPDSQRTPSAQEIEPLNETDLLAQPLSKPSPVKEADQVNPSAIETHLLAVVAELTGYPEETLALDMQIEADLGIDSIKRVEILSTLEERLPHIPPIAPESMGSIQTLRQIVEFLTASGTHIPPVRPSDAKEDKALEPTHPSNAASDSIEKTLLSVVSELTGYPTETLNLDMEIEADLGIDSIKRVEILSTVEEQMPNLPPVSPELVGRLKTLRQITAYLSSETQDTLSVQQSPDPVANHPAGILSDDDRISLTPAAVSDWDPPDRYDITLEKSAFTPGPELNLDPNRKVLITDNRTPLVGALERALAAKGIGSERILWETPLSDRSSDQSGRHDRYGGLILIPEPDWGQILADDGFLKQAFALTRQLSSDLFSASEKGGALLASITYLDGGFGFKAGKLKTPGQGGLAGLIKTARVEWPGIACRAFDLAPEWKEMEALAARIVRELLTTVPSSPVEVGFDPELEKDMRWIPTLQKRAPEKDDDAAPSLSEGDVVVVTGGGRGVTANAALALARKVKPTLVIMGRTPQPTDEPEWLASIAGEAAVKSAIAKYEFEDGKATPKEIATLYSRYMGNRELARSLNQLKDHCQTLSYFSVDVRQAEAVKSILNTVRSEHGDIKALIHGAGVIEDKHICDKSDDQFNRVFDTKVQGLHSLLKATASDPLQYLILFSSVTARMGNAGQVDYAMSNEVLNKTAQQLAQKHPHCRALSINWGPWDGGMVGPSLKNEFKRRNVDLLPMQTGAEAMVSEMASPIPPGGAEVVIGAALSPEPRQNTVGQPQKRADKQRQNRFSTTFSRQISLADYPILSDHRLGGKPVVPFALMTEWFAHGALHANPGLQLIGFDNMRLYKGIRLETEKRLIRLLAGKTIANGNIFEVDLELRNGNKGQKEMVHTSAKAILSDQLQKPPLFSMPDMTHKDRFPYTMKEAYEKILFHGKQLRGITEILGLSDQIVVARIQPAPAPRAWIKEPLRSQWIADPLVLDCAFQMATIWCHEKAGVVSLPSYCAAYRQYATRFPREEITVVLHINEVTRHKMVGDFTFLSPGREVVATLKGYEAVMDASLFRAFKTQNAA
jgi:NAD(P)-dependent dehydrogenase (short-subunit alcohol dehydrogenase family)/acyl carrier protein